jgi:N-acetylglucosamine-6-sulfatase
MKPISRRCLVALGALMLASNPVFAQTSPAETKAVASRPEAPARRPNIVFILTDDQRYDAMGFLDPALDTPNMDRMAREGVHFKNAVVTTALCSPSRASIMTGQYMHNHGIMDNNVQFASGARFFSQDLQAAGYATAFFGKWHMGGHSDAPQPGFDHWVSFAGQGNYLPSGPNGQPRHRLNVDGRHVEQQGYITDELNQYAMDWLKQQSSEKPFFLYLSHKAVHSDFIPAERHENLYEDREIRIPDTMANTPENNRLKPMWVRNQRNSWHGVEFPYHSELDIRDYRQRYNQTLRAVDDGIGVILAELEAKGMLENTIVFLMGDNGFMFGEHGLIDKRNAYEESMRVPLLAFSGGAARGQVVKDVVANIDMAPTFLDLAGVQQPSGAFDGRSFAAQLRGETPAEPWREAVLYEYYWEYNYPQTPTTFALRTGDYKLIQYHGIWDTEELYDLKNDPHETQNLIQDPAQQGRISEMRRELFERLDASGAGRSSVTFSERYGAGAVFRSRKGSKAADFPEEWLRNPGDPDVRAHTANEGGRHARNRRAGTSEK